MKIQIFYDACCDSCGRHLSTDFNCGCIYNKQSIKKICAKFKWTYNAKTKENCCGVCNRMLSNEVIRELGINTNF